MARTQLHQSGARPTERREGRGTSPAKTRSLQVRLALLVVFITTPALLLVAFLSLYAADRAMARFLEDRGLRTAEWLDDTFGPMNLADGASVQRELERIMRTRSGLRDMVVFAKDEESGALSSVASRAKVVAVAPSFNDSLAARDDRVILRRDELGWDLAAPIHAKGKVVGVVHAEVVLPATGDETLTGARLYLALAALGAVGLTGLALVFALDRAIARPVEQLVGFMEKARQGDLDVEVPVVHLDEFGWLGENFNRMLRKLKENDGSLRGLMEQVAQFNEQLQKQVALATEELAKKNDELARANRRLFEAQRALGNSERLASLGQLASQIAHEIGTPLNSIYGHIQLLGADEIPEGAKKRVAIVESQVERLTKIIENVLRTLRLPDAQLSEIEVAPVLTGVAAFMQPVAESRKIALATALPAALPRIYVDPRQLEQVLLNLITNALDAMPDGGTLTLAAEERKEGTESAVLVRVKDTGVGIAAEDLHRIFEPFFTTKAPGSGTGLGLPICKQILQKFRGTLTAESEGKGKGACFIVQLPALRTKSVDATVVAPPEAPIATAPPVATDEESATRTTDSSATTIDALSESGRLVRQPAEGGGDA